jgi:hypothetical protein
MAADPAFKIKLQLYCGDEIAMGPGKANGRVAFIAQEIATGYFKIILKHINTI